MVENSCYDTRIQVQPLLFVFVFVFLKGSSKVWRGKSVILFVLWCLMVKEVVIVEGQKFQSSFSVLFGTERIIITFFFHIVYVKMLACASLF